MKGGEVIIMILILIGLLFVPSLIIFEVNYDNGYYNAKQEDYCHNYCFDWFWNNLSVYDICNSECLKEKEYTNYWSFDYQEFAVSGEVEE